MNNFIFENTTKVFFGEGCVREYLRCLIKHYEGKSSKEIVCTGIAALEDFIREIGLPATLCELDVDEKTDLKKIADSCAISQGGYRKREIHCRTFSKPVFKHEPDLSMNRI